MFRARGRFAQVPPANWHDHYGWAVTAATNVLIRVLGPVELAVSPDPIGGPKQRQLLAALALRAGVTVTVGELTEILWPGDLPDDAQRSLQVHVSKLRRALDRAEVSAAIEHRGRGYVLEVEAGAVDAHRFADLVGRGSAVATNDPERARNVLQEALELWRGPPLLGLGDPEPLRSDVTRLEALHRQALEARVAADLATGRHHDVVAEARRLLDQDPLQEPLWGHLMTALYRNGRQGEALEAYGRARALLAEELGTDPSRELQELHRRILQQDPALDLDATKAQGAVGAPPPDERSLAVLPFEVMGGSDEAALLASGLHNDLLTELAKFDDLTVINRTSVLAYAGTDKSPREISRELDVGTIVQGAVQSAGSRVRLTIQVIDGPRNAYRWAQSYDDDLTTENLFGIQTSLARDIAESLSAELTHPGHGRGDGPATASLDAYRLVAAGRQQFDLKTREGFAGAIECYEEAVRLDPDYVNAWVGLADALVSMDLYGHGDRHDLLPRAEKAVHRALSLDTESAEARTSLGILHTGHQEGPSALHEFRRAIRLRPNYADAHNWHSWVSLLTGHVQAGLDSAHRAAELDPKSAEAHAHVALGLAGIGDPGGGVEAARTARRLAPYTTAAMYEAACLHDAGRHAEAVGILDELVGDGDDLAVPWAGRGPCVLLVMSLAAMGEMDRAEQVAALVDPISFPFAAGVISLALGDEDAATKAVARVDRLTAWPSLVIHHFHRDFWDQDHVRPHHGDLVEVALRSWDMRSP
jgi:DNA-binding SARP family transcriptional activator